MTTIVITIVFSAITAIVAYNAGLVRQHRKDVRIFSVAIEAMKEVVLCETREDAEDIVTQFKNDITSS